MLIRKGTKKDIPDLHKLIVELAIYEKAADEVEVSLNELENDCFGQNSICNFFVAEINNMVSGIALYYRKYSTWKGRCLFLEDIIVREEYRRKGIGEALFEKVIEVAKKEGVRRLEWQVLNWNQQAISFYKKFDSVFDDEWINCKMTYDQIQEFNFSR